VLFHVGDPVISGGGSQGATWYANQRHAIAKHDYIWEGEGANVLGADWAVLGGGVTESNASQARCTFTAAAWRTAYFYIITNFREIFDYKGQWRLFARVRTSDYTTTLFRAYFMVIDNPIPSATGMACSQNNVWEMHDMGTIDIPYAYGPQKLVSGEDWSSVGTGNHTFNFEAYTSAGTPTFDLDYFMLIPEGMIGKWGDSSANGGQSIPTATQWVNASDSVSYEAAASYYTYHNATQDPLFSLDGVYGQIFKGNVCWLEVLGKNRIPMIIMRQDAVADWRHEIRDVFQAFMIAQPRWRRMR